MRKLPFATLFALASCSPVENTFTIDNDKGAVTAAELSLCGSTTPLQRLDGGLTVSRPINCEDGGYIRLTFASGHEQACRVGYVTPGAKQDFRFLASEAECQPLVS